MALEWLLAKVGCRLAETPAQNGLGTFLTVENRRPPSASPVPPATTVSAGTPSSPQSTNTGLGAWGGDSLSAIPPALCDVALRENVRAELENAPWKKTGGDGQGEGQGKGGRIVFSLEDFADPAAELPWERGVGVEGEGGFDNAAAVSASGVGALLGGEGDDDKSGPVEQGAGKPSLASSFSASASTAEEARGRGRAGDQCDRVMVFGDTGERGAEQTAMFEVRETVDKGEVVARRGDGGGGGGRGERKEVDVVQVRDQSKIRGLVVCVCAHILHALPVIPLPKRLRENGGG